MPYVGRSTDKLSNVEVLDNITFNGSSSYTLQKGGSNFTPSSANTILLSIDGVVQAGNFTVSGSTIDFGVAIAGTSTCDFILHYGVGLITAPSDGTVTTAKLADSSVSLAKLTATGTKDATTFLRGDNTFDTPPLGGITEADCWRMTTDITGSGADLTLWERDDDAAAGYLGTGMSQSSGIFTFPSTGIWYVNLNCTVFHNGGGMNFYTKIDSTIDNSSYSEHARARAQQPSGSTGNMTGSCNAIIDVTNTSNVKVKFSFYSGVTSAYVQGNSSINITAATFIRLGDT